ncbi:MAG: hypothetical protein CMD20_01570 [Flavobacteriales bacterium]|nr:hypothetical protein [Flavobacteriales bacterium]
MHRNKTLNRIYILLIFFIGAPIPQYAGGFKNEMKKEPSFYNENKGSKTERINKNNILSYQHINMIKQVLKIDSLSSTELKQIEIITKSCINNDLEEALSWSYFATAKIYQSINQFEVAIEYLKLSQSGKNKIDAPNINLFFAELYSQTGEYQKSNSILKSIIQPKNKNSTLKTELLFVENLIALKQFEEAIQTLTVLQYRKLDKKQEVEIINKMAICYISTDQIDEGIEAYQEAISITEGLDERNNYRQRSKIKSSFSKTLKSNNRYEEDVTLIKASLNNRNRKANSLEYLRLAESYYALKNYEKAASSINQFIKNPNYALIDKSEITIIRNTARAIENKEQALLFIDFYTILEDTIAQRREKLKMINNGKGVENLLQLELLRKEKEISQNAINSLVKEDALKEDVLVASRWAIGLLLILILIGLFAVFYILKVSKQRRTANQKLALRTLRSQMNPHFIFNALNSVNSFISENDQRSANKFLTSFSRLMRLVMENSEYDFISTQKELEILEIYLELEHFRFKDKFDYKINVDDFLDDDDFEIPPMLIQPYIENAIWHGLRYKENSGNLTLQLTKKEKKLHVTISDNGIGRKKSAELKTSNQKKNRSTALRNIKERIHIVNELHGLKIDVSINDFNQDGTGTIVELLVPQNGFKK